MLRLFKCLSVACLLFITWAHSCFFPTRSWHWLNEWINKAPRLHLLWYWCWSSCLLQSCWLTACTSLNSIDTLSSVSFSSLWHQSREERGTSGSASPQHPSRRSCICNLITFVLSCTVKHIGVVYWQNSRVSVTKLPVPNSKPSFFILLCDSQTFRHLRAWIKCSNWGYRFPSLLSKSGT